MNNLDQTIQNNAASSKELAASSEQLTGTIETLKLNLDRLSHWIGVAEQANPSMPSSTTEKKQKTTPRTLKANLTTSKDKVKNGNPTPTSASRFEIPTKPKGNIDPFWGEAIQKIEPPKAS
jgi:septal ring factor EnvC (AmiA/AmiB activator)